MSNLVVNLPRVEPRYTFTLRGKQGLYFRSTDTYESEGKAVKAAEHQATLLIAAGREPESVEIGNTWAPKTVAFKKNVAIKKSAVSRVQAAFA